MNKKINFYSLILLALVAWVPTAFAQKPTQATKSVVDPRITTSPTTVVVPPAPVTNSNSNTETNTSSNTNTDTSTGTVVGVPATNTTGGDPNQTPTGVQGTSTNPTVLPNSTQTGGVNNSPNNSNNGKGGGKKRKKSNNPAPQEDIPIKAVGGEQTSKKDQAVTEDGRPLVTPANVAGNGVEVTGLKPAPGSMDWSQPVGGIGNVPVAPGSVPVTMVSTTNSSPVQDSPTVKLSCEDEAVKEVYKILSSDQNNAFGKMVELTTMKLARKALAEGNATLEGYTRSKIKELEAYFKKSKSGGEFYSKIQSAYQAMGKPSDAATINKDLDAALAQGKKACYWAGATDLDNKHVASYVLAVSAADPKSGLTEGDAATVWALDKIRGDTGSGGVLSMTNRVARYLGAVQGGKVSTTAQLDAAIASQQKELNALIASAKSKAEKSLVACFEQQNPSCTDCQAKAKANLSAATSSLEQVQQGLALAVKRSQATQMVTKFKGKAGEIEFDLGNFAKGAVKKDPSRLKGFDACGNVVGNQTANTSSTTTSTPDCKCTATQSNPCNCDPKGPAPFKGAYWSPEINAWTLPEVVVTQYTSAKNDVSCYKVKGCWDHSKKSCSACEIGWSVKQPPKADEQSYYTRWITQPVAKNAGKTASAQNAAKIAKIAAWKKMLNGTVWPDLCIKYKGCFDLNEKPMCGVCDKGEKPSVKGMPKTTTAYKLGTKNHISLNVEGLNIPLFTTVSGLDPKQHPTLNAIDHLSPIPLGTFYQMNKDAFTYQASLSSSALKIAHAQAEQSMKKAYDAMRDPANQKAVKNAVKKTNSYIKDAIWYSTPFGVMDLLMGD